MLAFITRRTLLAIPVLIGIVVVPRRKLSGPWLEGLLLVVSLTLVHMVFWSNMRMRAPAIPAFAIVAAAALQPHKRDRLPTGRD